MASSNTTNVVVLGSTGSIGQNALEVISASAGAMKAVGLTTHNQLELALELCNRHRPDCLVITNPEKSKEFDARRLPPETQLMVGSESIEELVSRDSVNVVVSAIVGSAGLQGTIAAIQAGKRVALANKESLVLAGQLVMNLVKQYDAEIIPVDSEHSAVFQAMASGQPKEIRKILLTASGGPFRSLPIEELAHVTVEQALAHPTWSMGPKVTVDSATMMNKALEIIEARWLFDLRPDQIGVVVHPQSVVHSFVEFLDGSVIAQLSPPDMKLPIQYALTYPERTAGVAEKLDWTQTMTMEFEPPDLDRFPALTLGFEVAAAGGSAGAVLNAANEAAVDGFLNGRLSFCQIVPVCRSVLENHNYDPSPSLDELLRFDQWARTEVKRRVCT